MGLRIETTRLILRRPKMSDARLIALYAGDIDIARMTATVPHPYPKPAAEMWVMIQNIRSRHSSNAHLIIDMKSDEDDHPTMCGMAGLFRRSTKSPLEIGYWIAKPYWGKGFATEAGQGLIDYARNEMKATQIIAGHNEDNPASGKVLEKLGFHYTGTSAMSYSLGRLAEALVLDMELI